MRNISIFRKLKLYSRYKKAIEQNSVELQNKYGMRIDDANRLYTVLNIPEDIFGEAYAIKKADIDRVADNYIRAYSSDLGSFLDSKGINELYDFYDLQKVGKFSYLVVIGFSLFRTDERRSRIYKIWIPLISSFVLLSIILAFLL